MLLHWHITDPFERACHVVSQHIDEDWAQLYRNLPFVPPRGLKTIDNDISRFSMVCIIDNPINL